MNDTGGDDRTGRNESDSGTEDVESERIDPELMDTVEALRGLPSEATPTRDLWPEIQARIATAGTGSAGSGTSLGSHQKAWWSRSVSVPWAIAASVALASAIGYGTWQVAQIGQAAVVATGPESGTPSTVRTVGLDPVEEPIPDYDQAVIGLRQAYEAGKDRLTPETVQVLEQSLQAIDDAIAEARAAIEADPARHEVRRILYHNMNRKLDVLRQAAVAVQDRA